jgi:hypothetical protein
MMLADISSGNTGFADVMFLVGFILFVLAMLASAPPVVVSAERSWWWRVLVAAGLACVALAWLVL